MKLFDVAIYSDQRPEEDFANLAWFDVQRVLTLAHAPRRFETAQDLWHYLEALVVSETERLLRHGLTAHAVVGVHPAAIPERAHDELWQELPWLLQDPKVAALGQLGLRHNDRAEWHTLEQQLAIMALHHITKPIFFALPATMDTRDRLQCLDRFAELVRHHGLPPSQILILRAGWLTIDQIEAHGFWAGLLCGPLQLNTEEILRICQHHDTRRLVMGTGLTAGPSDILALPKLAFALSEAGHSPQDIERLLYGNALRMLGA